VSVAGDCESRSTERGPRRGCSQRAGSTYADVGTGGPTGEQWSVLVVRYTKLAEELS
jgi:hypothetical protein